VNLLFQAFPLRPGRPLLKITSSRGSANGVSAYRRIGDSDESRLPGCLQLFDRRTRGTIRRRGSGRARASSHAVTTTRAATFPQRPMTVWGYPAGPGRNAHLLRQPHQLGHGEHSHLLHHAGAMGLYGAKRDAEFRADLLVEQFRDHQPKGLKLSRRQPVPIAGRSALIHLRIEFHLEYQQYSLERSGRLNALWKSRKIQYARINTHAS
jgi:hypothetical protein